MILVVPMRRKVVCVSMVHIRRWNRGQETVTAMLSVMRGWEKYLHQTAMAAATLALMAAALMATAPAGIANVGAVQLRQVEGLTQLSQLCEGQNIRQIIGAKEARAEDIESAIYGLAVQIETVSEGKTGPDQLLIGIYSYMEDSQRLLPEYLAFALRQLRIPSDKQGKRQILPCAAFFSASEARKTSQVHSGLVRPKNGVSNQLEPIVLISVALLRNGSPVRDPAIASGPTITPAPPGTKSASTPAPPPPTPPAPRPAVTTPPSPAAPLGRRVALVVGNGAYAHVSALPNPRRDADAIAQMLRRVGFAEVRTIMDADHAQLTSGLKSFGDLAEGSDWAMVYFAGHGIEMGGMPFLIPIDARLERDTHVRDEAVALERVLEKVASARQLRLVILDACRNNPFAARMTRTAGYTRSVDHGLSRVEPDGDVLVAYSAKHGTVAEDGTGTNSPFVAALLEQMPQPGVDIRIMFGRVRDAVRRATSNRQEPYLYGSVGGESHMFMPTAR